MSFSLKMLVNGFCSNSSWVSPKVGTFENLALVIDTSGVVSFWKDIELSSNNFISSCFLFDNWKLLSLTKSNFLYCWCSNSAITICWSIPNCTSFSSISLAYLKNLSLISATSSNINAAIWVVDYKLQNLALWANSVFILYSLVWKSYLSNILFSLLKDNLLRPAVLHSYNLSPLVSPRILEPDTATDSKGIVLIWTESKESSTK